MTAMQEGRSRPARDSACPQRLRNVNATHIIPDLILTLIVIGLALSIITDPTAGPIDGRHLLAGAAALILIARTTRATQR